MSTGPGRVLVTGAVIGLAAVLWLAAAPGAVGGETPTDEPPDGEALYLSTCSSCHGVDGSGGIGPPIVDVGAAGASFQISTGRMPVANVDAQPVRKPPALNPEQIDAVVEHVATFGDGPPIPDVDPERGDLAEGGVLFRANCAACHSATGVGTSLSYGAFAPSLYEATALQVAEAIRTGPNMPVFDPDQFSVEDVDSIVAYVLELQANDNPGGLGLGRGGPIPEGAVGWLVGIVGLIGAALWIEKRAS